jgi:hypothetical protein
VLYRAELYEHTPFTTLAHIKYGAGSEDRTRVTSLEGWDSTAELYPHVQKHGGGGWIRTTEAFASDLQSDPFGRSGTPPSYRAFYLSKANHQNNLAKLQS